MILDFSGLMLLSSQLFYILPREPNRIYLILNNDSKSESSKHNTKLRLPQLWNIQEQLSSNSTKKKLLKKKSTKWPVNRIWFYTTPLVSHQHLSHCRKTCVLHIFSSFRNWLQKWGEWEIEAGEGFILKIPFSFLLATYNE